MSLRGNGMQAREGFGGSPRATWLTRYREHIMPKEGARVLVKAGGFVWISQAAARHRGYGAWTVSGPTAHRVLEAVDVPLKRTCTLCSLARQPQSTACGVPVPSYCPPLTESSRPYIEPGRSTTVLRQWLFAARTRRSAADLLRGGGM